MAAPSGSDCAGHQVLEFLGHRFHSGGKTESHVVLEVREDAAKSVRLLLHQAAEPLLHPLCQSRDRRVGWHKTVSDHLLGLLGRLAELLGQKVERRDSRLIQLKQLIGLDAAFRLDLTQRLGNPAHALGTSSEASCGITDCCQSRQDVLGREPEGEKLARRRLHIGELEWSLLGEVSHLSDEGLSLFGGAEHRREADLSLFERTGSLESEEARASCGAAENRADAADSLGYERTAGGYPTELRAK